MKRYLKLIVCVFCILYSFDSYSNEMMKNVEVKVQLDQKTLHALRTQLTPYYVETLNQTDTYFASKDGRLKLREETNKTPYLIRYRRPDLTEPKESHYLFYPVQDVHSFISCMGDSLKEECKIKKERALYCPKPHIRIHLDQVENLGEFLEIEILLLPGISLSIAHTEIQELLRRLQITHLNKIDCGYQELLQRKAFENINRDFTYYKIQNKVFWVIANDLNVAGFKRYDVIPCIFVEQFDDGRYGIIQLDPTIANDDYQYTAWRKLIGQIHNFKADVLLIDRVGDKLYTLKGEEVSFDSLSRSSRLIDKSYLAPFARKK